MPNTRYWYAHLRSLLHVLRSSCRVLRDELLSQERERERERDVRVMPSHVDDGVCCHQSECVLCLYVLWNAVSA